MNKYGNRRVKADGFTFDSQAEYRRYTELRLLERVGGIRNLDVHPRFDISPAGRDPYTGKLIRARKYEADFSYVETKSGQVVAEDVKGAATQLFKLKWDIVRLRYPHIEFRLINV